MISHWTKEELSYRSIQRFFSDKISWIDLCLKLFLMNIFTGQKLILAVDETIVTKSGKANSIQDLISTKRAEKYLFETFKLLSNFHPNILLPTSFDSITSLGCINL